MDYSLLTSSLMLSYRKLFDPFWPKWLAIVPACSADSSDRSHRRAARCRVLIVSLHIVAAGELLGPQPQRPVPEVIINWRQRRGSPYPRRPARVRSADDAV